MEYRSQRRLLRQLSQNIHWSNSSCPKVRCALLLGALLLVAAPSFCADPPRPVKVLLLFFGDKDSPAFSLFQNGLRTSVEQGLNAPVWIYDESFDEGWLGHDSSYAQTMERFLRDKYAKRGIDIVVAVGDYPLQYLQKRRKTLLPDAKLMYVSWQSPKQSIPDTTGLVWKLDLAPTLEVALTQNPGTHHVLLITGATAFDRGLAQLLLPTGLKYLQERHKEVDIQILSPGTLDETLSALAALPQETITVFATYYGDSAGQGFVPARILPTFSAITNRPLYGWIDSYFGHGIVGGSLTKTEAIGAAFGDLVLRVVRGEKPGTIPEVRVDLRQNEFDWQQIKRWGIGMHQVPAGSIVINREYTIWELYKWRIIGLLGLVAIEAVLIFALIRLAFAQKRNLRQLLYQRELAALVGQLAAAFINLPAELVNAEMERSFQRLLEFFDLDRISLFEFSAGKTQLRLLCARSSIGVEQPPAVFDLHQLPWTAAQILGGAPIVASHLGQLPEEASELKKVLRAHGVRSFITFPLQREESTFATLSFSTVRNERDWKPELVQAVRTIADILGSALERRSAEEAARRNRARLSGIVESAMDAIMAVDAQQSIVVFNATAEKMFGCSVEEALGQPLERFIPHRFRAQHHAHISRFAETGVANRAMGTLGALWALRANGEEFPIEASISQLEADGEKLFTCTVRDVTERERTQQHLAKSQELNASILESLSNHLAVLDAKGNIVAATKRVPEFVAATGINLLDLRVGTNYFEVCRAAMEAGDSDVAAAMAGVQAVYDGRRDHFEMEYGYNSGIEQRWFLMSVTPLKTQDGGIVLSQEDITGRKRHEQVIQELSGRLITAQEQERSRIARELHDDINQQVAMVAIELQQLEKFFPEDSLEGRQKIEALWKKTHALSTDIQHLSHQLHSAKLEHLGIIAALRGLCGEFSEQHKIEADFQFRQVQPGLDPDIALSLFRVAQESLQNVAKHSQAKKVRMELVGIGGQVVLRVSDDGVGFDPDAPKHRSGLGMVSMSERIRLVGGTLSVWSRPSMGTQVEAAIPLSSGALAGNRTWESEPVSPGSKVG